MDNGQTQQWIIIGCCRQVVIVDRLLLLLNLYYFLLLIFPKNYIKNSTILTISFYVEIWIYEIFLDKHL